MLGTGAIGRFAFTQFPQDDDVPLASALPWTSSVRRAGLSAAVIATTVVGFVPPQVRAAPVFSSLSSPQPARRVLAAEHPSTWLYEFTPLAVSFTGFMDFGTPRAARYSFADQQTSTLFEVEFVPLTQGGGTSRKLEFSEPVADAPRRSKRTGFEPIRKAETQLLIEPPKPALLLPLFESTPEAPLDERSPFDLVDPALIPQDLVGLRAEIHAAQTAYLDEQDARDIADIAALLDSLDEDEA